MAFETLPALLTLSSSSGSARRGRAEGGSIRWNTFAPSSLAGCLGYSLPVTA